MDCLQLAWNTNWSLLCMNERWLYHNLPPAPYCSVYILFPVSATVARHAVYSIVFLLGETSLFCGQHIEEMVVHVICRSCRYRKKHFVTRWWKCWRTNSTLINCHRSRPLSIRARSSTRSGMWGSCYCYCHLCWREQKHYDQQHYSWEW